MSTATDVNPTKVVIDTNILISGIGFRGRPREVLNLALETRNNSVQAVISSVLLAELEDVIIKKFSTLEDYARLINKKIRKSFKIVKPKKTLKVVRDDDDNRVIEAAVEGKCEFIITGDKDLLELGNYKGVKIVTANQFLTLYIR